MNKTGNSEQEINEIQSLISTLGNPDEQKRSGARLYLIDIGKKATPYLIQSLSQGDCMIRWETAKILSVTRDRSAVPALVTALQDEDHDVRWAAMDALINIDQEAMEPLLKALIKDFDSVFLRNAAHHILHVLRNKGHLDAHLFQVLQALEEMEPEVTVPWAAQDAWQALFGKKKAIQEA